MENRNHNKAEWIYGLGEILIEMIPREENVRIEDNCSLLKTASGSAAIFACAAQKLGGKAGFIGKIGLDPLSRFAESVIRKEGVNLQQLTHSNEGQIGLSFVEYTETGRHFQFYRNRSVGSLLREEDLDEERIASAYAVHFPGMLLELTDEMRGACERLIKIAKEHQVLLSFDPNIRKEIARNADAKKRLQNAVCQADIIAPTLEEGKMITGEESIGAVLRALHAMGPRVVALTRDRDGAILSMDGMTAAAQGIHHAPIDPTGAGDTFAAALCVGLRENMPLDRLAGFCNCAGALAIGHRGTIGLALPTRRDVEELMASDECIVDIKSLSAIL